MEIEGWKEGGKEGRREGRTEVRKIQQATTERRIISI